MREGGGKGSQEGVAPSVVGLRSKGNCVPQEIKSFWAEVHSNCHLEGKLGLKQVCQGGLLFRQIAGWGEAQGVCWQDATYGE